MKIEKKFPNNFILFFKGKFNPYNYDVYTPYYRVMSDLSVLEKDDKKEEWIKHYSENIFFCSEHDLRKELNKWKWTDREINNLFSYLFDFSCCLVDLELKMVSRLIYPQFMRVKSIIYF